MVRPTSLTGTRTPNTEAQGAEAGAAIHDGEEDKAFSAIAERPFHSSHSSRNSHRASLWPLLTEMLPARASPRATPPSPRESTLSQVVIPEDVPEDSEVILSGAVSPVELSFDVHVAFMRHLRSEQVRVVHTMLIHADGPLHSRLQLQSRLSSP
jgi:hypothetical protein